jgi:hypothetical protein
MITLRWVADVGIVDESAKTLSNQARPGSTGLDIVEEQGWHNRGPLDVPEKAAATVLLHA